LLKAKGRVDGKGRGAGRSNPGVDTRQIEMDSWKGKSPLGLIPKCPQGEGDGEKGGDRL